MILSLRIALFMIELLNDLLSLMIDIALYIILISEEIF